MKSRRGSTSSPISIEKTLVREGGVLDGDLHEHAVLRVHRRLPELLGVHLAEALEAAHLDALLREVDDRVPRLVERGGGAGLLAERDGERRRADDLEQPRIRLLEPGVHRRREQRRRKLDVRGRVRLPLDELDAEDAVGGAVRQQDVVDARGPQRILVVTERRQEALDILERRRGDARRGDARRRTRPRSRRDRHADATSSRRAR